MQKPEQVNPEFHELESALKSLTPSPSRIDPIAAAFTAGRMSRLPQLRIWRFAAVLMLFAAVGIRLLPAARNAAIHPRDISEYTVAFHPPESPSEPPAPQSLQALRETVRGESLDAIPAANLPRVQLITLGNILN